MLKYHLDIQTIIQPNIQLQLLKKLVNWTDNSSDLHRVDSSGHYLVALFLLHKQGQIHMDLTPFFNKYV